MQSRIKRIHVSKSELNALGADIKYFYLALHRKLPADAIIFDITDNYPMDLYILKIRSAWFDELAETATIPIIECHITTTDIAYEKGLESHICKTNTASGRKSGSPAACICDFAYTGLRDHKHNCPAK